MFIATKSFFIVDSRGNHRAVKEGATITTAQYNQLNQIKKGFCEKKVSERYATKLENAGDKILAELMAG